MPSEIFKGYNEIFRNIWLKIKKKKYNEIGVSLQRDYSQREIFKGYYKIYIDFWLKGIKVQWSQLTKGL